MIELTETPTFAIENFYDTKNIRFLDYLEYESIPYEIMELNNSELSNRHIVYHPVIIDKGADLSLLFKSINDIAIKKARKKELVILFIYHGNENIFSKFESQLIEQLISMQLLMTDIRIITGVNTLSFQQPFIYFPFAEMEAYMVAKQNELIKSFNDTPREKIFTCNVHDDTPHSRLMSASIWYHDLAAHSYFNYTNNIDSKKIINSDVYKWNTHWAATGTLMDMFGQQLPKNNCKINHPDYYNNAYWNITCMNTFNQSELSLSQNIFDPILNLQPFILIGPPGSLKLLRKLGYDTFKNHINESYDTIINDEERMQSLFRLVYELAFYPSKELDILNDKIMRSLNKNKEHLLASKKFKLISLLNSIKVGN